MSGLMCVVMCDLEYIPTTYKLYRYDIIYDSVVAMFLDVFFSAIRILS